jgi:signal transduction histidine kinase
MFLEDDIDISRIELKKLVDFLPYPIIIRENIEGEYLYFFFNKNFIKKIGYRIHQAPTNMDLVKLLYPDKNYRNEIVAEWTAREQSVKLAGKGFIKIKAHVSCKSGEQKWFEVKGSIIKNMQIVAFVNINSDIVLQEKLKKKNLNNDRMLSILGHDLRSPIANLISISSMAEQSEISQQEFISMMKIIKEESLETLQLLDTTFNWAKLNFNNIRHSRVLIDFNVLLNDVLKGCKSTFENKNITFTVDVGRLNNIHNDLGILTVILRNLISNAIKFTSENGCISISASSNDLIITDNGIGMTSEMVEAILDRNYSTRRGTANEKGVGIGLQLVMNLVEKINCKLFISSEVSKGTTVRIFFMEHKEF